MQKRRGSQSQGAKGEVVALYCDLLATPDLVSSGFLGRVKKRENYRYALDCTIGELQSIGSDHAFCSLFLIVEISFALFYATLRFI
jgi:hypothetical protein